MLSAERQRMHTLIADLMAAGFCTATEFTGELLAAGFGDVRAAKAAVLAGIGATTETTPVATASSNYEAQESLMHQLHTALTANQLTLTDVAQKLELSEDEARSWIDGDVDLRLSELRQLANAIGVRIEYRSDAVKVGDDRDPSITYHRTPETVEAMLFNGGGTLDDARAAAEWCGGTFSYDKVPGQEMKTYYWMMVLSTAGATISGAHPGDYIVKGADGQFRVYKSAAFTEMFQR